MGTLTAVDLFAGAGGGSIGLDRAGVEVVGAVDIDSAAVKAYRNNPVDIEPLQADLTEIDFHEIGEHYGFNPDDVDLVIGCPPCQNFSSLRDTTPWPEDDPKDELLLAFYQHVREARPEYVLFENVPGIATTDGGVYLEWLVKRMDELGYGKAVKVVDAADYGVPQRRKRTVGLFALGRSDGDVTTPECSHAISEEAAENGKDRHRAVGDVIDDLPALSAGEMWDNDPAHRARNHRQSTLDIIRAVPEDGGSRTDIEDEDLVLECHRNLDNPTSAASVYGRMSWNDPAPTLTTRCTTPSCGRFIHPFQDRGITFREAARLMGFPDFELPGKNNEAERVVGNAVPPELMSKLTGHLVN